MLVYGFTEEKMGVMYMENTLEAMQAFVGGRIEKTALTDCIAIISNEDSIRLGLKPRIIFRNNEEFMNAIILGDCFVCRHDSCGNFTSIQKEDEEIIAKQLIHLNQEKLASFGILFLLASK